MAHKVDLKIFNPNMDHIIITGGPTNESIDQVMKITNMSTGKLAIQLANDFFYRKAAVTVVGNKSLFNIPVDGYSSLSALRDLQQIAAPQAVGRIRFIEVETTQDMMDTLQELSEDGIIYDMIIHTAAVADYKTDFTFVMEDLMAEVADYIVEHRSVWPYQQQEEIFGELMSLASKGKYRISNSSKISSYQPNLCVKLGLTPKIISNLRSWFPNSELVGFKLLENVDKDELIEVGAALREKNKMDIIIANDLSVLRSGKRISHIITEEGAYSVESASEIGAVLVDWLLPS